MTDASAQAGPLFRPLISSVRLAPDRASIEVTLELGDRIAVGRAPVVDGDTLTAAGRATTAAVNQMTPPGIVVTLSWCRQVPGADAHRTVVNSSVRLSSSHSRSAGDRGEELLGAVFVRTDPQVAAVRATLDGLTRRVAQLVAE